jgi:hypothetical protein
MMNIQEMTEEYAKSLKDGLEYQDYIVEQLWLKGISFAAFLSKKNQLKGENSAGIEIKHDNRMSETNNLYIETHEKANIERKRWTFSGINRYDNTFMWIIGDYQVAYMLFVETLRKLNRENDTIHKYRRVDTGTSKGFLLPVKDVIEFGYGVVFFDNRPKEPEVISCKPYYSLSDKISEAKKNNL